MKIGKNLMKLRNLVTFFLLATLYMCVVFIGFCCIGDTQGADFEVDVVQNVEQLVGLLLDLAEVDDHVVDVDDYVQPQQVLQSPL